MADTGNSEKNPSAWEIVGQIQERYSAFTADAGEHEKAKAGLAGLFEKWFRGTSPSNPEPVYMDFLNSVQALTDQLAGALSGENAEERDASILAAAKIMLAAKPIDNKSQAEWYMVAAEHHFSGLIPLLTTETLRGIRDDYLKSHPKRMMYPRQLELFKQMNKAIDG